MQAPPAVGIHSIDHFALRLPDLADAQRFVAAFGFDVAAQARELQLRTAGNPHLWVRLLEGAKGLAYLSVGCHRDDLAALQRQAQAAGARAAAPFPGVEGGGFWLADPDGNLVQVKAAVSTQPAAKQPMPDASTPAGVRGVAGRVAAGPVRPTRLSHVLLFTPDVGRMIDFYVRALGLKLSDRSGNLIAFLHGRHGSDHHLVAFALSPAKGFHHSSWDVPRFDDVGAGAMQMRNAGYREQWGVGRHVLGSNYFDYVRDDAGAWWEYSCHIDYVPAGVEWAAGDHAAEDSFYLWGPDVPSSFIENHEADAAAA